MIPETGGVSSSGDKRRVAAQIFLLGAASLYFELAVIRFTSAEVLYLGYFSNFILLSAFVGLALGFLAAKRAFDLGAAAPCSLVFLVALVLLSHFDAAVLRDRNGLFFFGNALGKSGIPGVVLLVVLFLVVSTLFAGIGQELGRAFARLAPLQAYTFDIAGSLLGIGFFTLQAAAWSGPAIWMITGTCFLTLGHLAAPGGAGRKTAAFAALGGACAALLVIAPEEANPTTWSMYQKLEYVSGPNTTPLVYANGVGHQFLSATAGLDHSYYALPYEYRARAHDSVDRVLIIGAGTGTDVAMALSKGAKSIDAVEIDPGIVAIGRAHHPDDPYADPRVTVHVDDGRAFLRNTDARYDLVIFALPDSLVRLSSLTNLRLESYLFTVEAFADARAHLADGGVLVLYNQYRWDWLRGRIAATLEHVFGRPPLQIQQGRITVFVAGASVDAPPIDPSGFEGLATDDWPHVYMQRRGIPWVYVGMIAMFLIVSVMGIAALAPPKTLRRPDGPFFFMGAAFLLLETKSISTFSLLFGTTWLVNSLTFGGILVSVLVANLMVRLVGPRARPLLFALLFGSLAVAYLAPPSALLAIASIPLRYGLTVLLVFAPIFFANLLFSSEFAGTSQSASAFGWNLLGAVAGGGLEYVGLVVGQRNLLVLAALAYALVAMSLARRARSGGGAATAAPAGA